MNVRCNGKADLKVRLYRPEVVEAGLQTRLVDRQARLQFLGPIEHDDQARGRR